MNWEYFKPQFEYEALLNDAGLHWSGHKNFAYDLVLNLQPKIIVELGTWRGTSFFSFCQAIKDSKSNTKIYAVDTWKGDLHMGKFDDTIYKSVENMTRHFYDSVNYYLLKMPFDHAVKKIEDNSIDILHIDGLHTYEGVRHDFEIWLNKVSDNGIILFHDIKVGEKDFGVYKLWNELKNQYPTMEFFHSFGLGILFKSKDVANSFLGLNKEMQMYYSYNHEMKKNEIINQKIKEVEISNNDIAQKNKEIEFMKSSKFWKFREIYLNLKNKFRIK